MNLFPRVLLALWPVLAVSAVSAVGQEWTRFRGPNGQGIVEGAGIPATWKLEDMAWRLDLPGVGHSQPVVWGTKLFVTSAADEGGSRLVLCYDTATGKELWRWALPAQTHKKHRLNSFASATPTVDGQAVYCVFDTADHYWAVALDHAGKEMWKADLGPTVTQHTMGASPVIFEDLLIINNEQEEDGTAAVVALSVKDGRVAWKTDRKGGAASYATPCVLETPNQPPLLLCSSNAHGLYTLVPRTGTPVWESPLFTLRACSSPVIAGGLTFGTCGKGGGGNYLIAIRPGGQGNVSESHLAYTLRKAIPYVPTPVAHGNLLFLWETGGVVQAVDIATGETKATERITGEYFGSPIRIDDRLYIMTTRGECVVVQADETLKELARNPIGDGSHSTLAVADGRLFIRTFTQLLCLPGTGRKVALRD